MTAHIAPTRLLRMSALLAVVAALTLFAQAIAAPAADAGVSQRTSYVSSGGYRTLATLWNTNVKAEFLCPAGAKIRVRYGGGWLAKNRQEQKLDCRTAKRVSVSRFSVFVARIQIKVPQSGYVSWAYITESA